MNRGAAYRDIFQHDTHRELFLELLREIHEMFGVEIYVYYLMDNHYHFHYGSVSGTIKGFEHELCDIKNSA